MSQNDILPLENELNRTVLQGDILGAFDRFYADDVTMQENDEPPTVGKAANRAREEAFLAAVETFHGATLGPVAVADGVSFSEWTLDLTFKGAPRSKMHQVSVRTWKGGKVSSERFFYQKG